MVTAQSSALHGTRLVFRETGQPAAVLEVESFTPRVPEHGEVLVRILAAPVNPADLNTVEGTYGVKLELPATPGIEGCGEVLASRDDGIAPGDRVIFLRRADTWATHSTVPAASLFKLPPGIDPQQAALLKVNPATAWQLLHGFERLHPGDCIVQNAGNSAVGRCVIQIARDLGIRTISFVRRPELIGELLAHVRRGDIEAVHSLRRGAAEALEGVVRGDRKTSRLAGRRVEEIALPAGAQVGAIVRGLHRPDGSEGDDEVQAQAQVIIPHHDTVIQSLDHVVIFVPRKHMVREVEKLFQVSATFLF